jgi:iron(III) transport system substrate-binding protein
VKLGLLLYSFLFIAILISGCKSTKSDREVVIYTSVDQVFSEAILMQFQEETGIKVLPVYDVEAAKTTGLVNRLIAEKANPQADVYWSGEFAQTILLKEEGVLAAYISPNSVDIPSQYKDPEGFWTGVAGRARVLIVNKDLVPSEDWPTSIDDLLEPKWTSSQIGIAYPLFGTTSTHASALYALLGPEEAKAYFQALKDREISVVDGNSVVRDLVASGQLSFGLTDTDDACGAIEKGAPVAIVIPDQGENDIGTLIIPNTVTLIEGAPHLEEGQVLVDYLLSKEVEEAMILSGWSHIALRPLTVEQTCLETVSIQGMEVTLMEVYDQLERAKSDLTSIFIR